MVMVVPLGTQLVLRSASGTIYIIYIYKYIYISIVARLKRSDSRAEKVSAMAASKKFSSMEIIDIPEKPFQPTHLVFSPRAFGQTS